MSIKGLPVLFSRFSYGTDFAQPACLRKEWHINEQAYGALRTAKEYGAVLVIGPGQSHASGVSGLMRAMRVYCGEQA